MKKYIAYIVILIVGFALGSLFYMSLSDSDQTHSHELNTSEKQMWTCSMHPQIMQPEPGSCPICGMDLIPAISGEAGLSSNQFTLTKNALALADVETSIIGKSGAASDQLRLSGKILENEENIGVQVSYFSGRIEKLYINATGVKVRKGQLLATIYAPELLTAQQELITASSIKESQPSLYQAVKNKLKLWKLTDQQISQIESSGKVQEYFSIYSTVSGTVVQKLVAQGDAVKQGMTLFKITDLNSVWAVFDVYEDQIDLVKKGQIIEVRSNAFPDETIVSRVTFIDPVLDQSTRTVKIRTELNNTSQNFKPGMFVEGTLQPVASDDNDQLLIPASAVLWTGKRSVVYQKINPDQPVFEMKEVQLGNKINDTYEVLEGLKAGDEIVSHGTFTVDAAAQLQGKKSMMNRSQNTESNRNSEQEAGSDLMHTRVDAGATFKASLQDVFSAYLGIKDALVSDSFEQVLMYSEKMERELSKVNSTSIKDKESEDMWKKVKAAMEESNRQIGQSKDIEAQRSHFKDLSGHTAMTVQMFGVGQKVYHQYCPMADNDMGAYWLSDSNNVLNPYFGKAMLACGSVKEVIPE